MVKTLREKKTELVTLELYVTLNECQAEFSKNVSGGNRTPPTAAINSNRYETVQPGGLNCRESYLLVRPLLTSLLYYIGNRCQLSLIKKRKDFCFLIGTIFAKRTGSLRHPPFGL